MVERSMRRIDPLATLASFPLTVAAACAAPLVAVLLTAQHIDEIDSPGLMASALLVLLAACVLLVNRVLSANAVRQQFSSLTHLTIVGLVVLAAVLAAAAQWRSNDMLRDDWGALAVGILLLGIAPYRSIRSLIISGAVAAAIIGGLAAVQAQPMVSEVPTVAYVVLAMTPVLALAAGGVAYAVAAVQSRERWQLVTEEVARANASNLRDPIARSVQQERVTLLDREVVPFFSGLLSRDSITPNDAEHAQRIATTVRSIMVAEANRSWLGSTIDELAERAGVGPLGAVMDLGKVSDRMTFGQRAALRALLDALLSHPGFNASTFSAVAAASDNRCSVRITASVCARPRTVNHVVAPYLAVIRAVFCDLEVTVASPDLTLRFSYEY
jgi:hypothetical protein